MKRDYEGGALFVALLIYPDQIGSDEIMGALHASLINWYFLLAKAASDRTWEVTAQSVKPIYAMHERRVVVRDLRQLERRQHYRMVAARIAVPFLQEVELGEVPPLPPSVMRLSLNEMFKLVGPNAGQRHA